jgi:hypothetical protein
MDAPFRTDWGWKRQERWNYHILRMVEYVVWHAGRPMGCLEIVDILRRKYKIDPGQSNVTHRLMSLLEEGRVVRLRRGVYQHVDVARIMG